jgi:GH15 family glucan-1,4-alpha-glucosidase
VHLGYFDPEDPRAARHVDAIRRGLSVDGGLLRRYAVPDDFGHMEAAFTVCTFWLVEALAIIGRTDEAKELFDRLLSLDNGLGLFSEDLLPDTYEQTGNFPQTYSHVGVINAAFRLSRRWD